MEDNMKLTPEDFKSYLDKIFISTNNLEEITQEMMNLKDDYPFIRDESPFKELYWDAVKKWHTLLRQTKDEHSKGRIEDIANRRVPRERELDPNYELDTTTFDNYNSRIKNFGSFLNEAAGGSEVQKEAKKIIGEMFAVGKNIKFSGDQDGEPEFVEFEIDENDYKLGYSEDLKMEYSTGVLAKRKYQVSLKYKSKSKEGTDNKSIYKIKFKINLKGAGDVKSNEKEVELAWEFESKPTKVIDFIKKGKQKCEWESSENRLYISKSSFDKLATDQLKVLIREEGGQKIRIK